MKASLFLYIATGFCTASIFNLYMISYSNLWSRFLVILAALFFIFYLFDRFRRIDVTRVYKKIKKFSLIDAKTATYKLAMADNNNIDAGVDFKPFFREKIYHVAN